MKWISFFLVTSLMFLNSAFSVYKPRVIYGDDNRADLYQIQDQTLLKIAGSTAAMFQLSSLMKVGNVFKILSGNFASRYDLCPGEPFADQTAAAMCSGFLVGPDLVATAGHCIRSENCSSMAFAFGFAVRSEAQVPTQIAEEDLYFCKNVVQREYTRQQDYSLVQLDRVVRGHDVLKLASQSVQVNDPLIVIGHPAGLPTKVAGGAGVRESQEAYFVANLDTYGGNSGSAVFNAETLEVTGILVRGETDFVYDRTNKCYRSNQCSATGCRGEDVTNISFITQALNTTYLE